jgi:hypothetical protein
MDRQDRARYRRDALGNAMVDPHSIASCQGT